MLHPHCFHQQHISVELGTENKIIKSPFSHENKIISTAKVLILQPTTKKACKKFCNPN